MDYFKARVVQVVSLVIALIFVLIARVFDSYFWFALTLVPLAGYVVGCFFCKCPCCGRHLTRHHMFISYCPYCGAAL